MYWTRAFALGKKIKTWFIYIQAGLRNMWFTLFQTAFSMYSYTQSMSSIMYIHIYAIMYKMLAILSQNFNKKWDSLSANQRGYFYSGPEGFFSNSVVCSTIPESGFELMMTWIGCLAERLPLIDASTVSPSPISSVCEYIHFIYTNFPKTVTNHAVHSFYFYFNNLNLFFTLFYFLIVIMQFTALRYHLITIN